MSDEGERRVSEEAFSLLGHEVRLDILRAFFERHEPVDPASLDDLKDERHLSYAELMDAVGMRDSGRFNYHLDQLRGVYVEQVDGAYAPTASAVALHRAVVANRPTDPSPGDLGEVDCPLCGAGLAPRYEQEYLTVECGSCDGFWGLTYAFPKNGLAVRDPGEVFEALRDRLLSHVGLARTGQCPSCAGRTAVSIPRERLDGDRTPTTEMTCRTCSWLATVDVLSALQSEPRVAAALVELGVAPVRDDAATAEETPTVTGTQRSASPFRAAIDVAAGGGVATVVVDADLGVRSVEVE